MALGALGAVGVIAAAPAVAPTPNVKAQEAAHITPHRAIYAMKLASVKNGSDISDVSGRMLFEWRDVCDGWAIQQHMQLHFSYNDNNDQDAISTELTWEAKDGKSYTFNIRRVTDGKETENYRGKAAQNADGSVAATYTIPEGKKVQLPIGTLFPSAHTALILQQAAKGEKFFSRRVFDGSDEDGSSDISAFILTRPTTAEDSNNAKLHDNSLLAVPSWPVHLAFFKIGDDAGEPDYEMDMNLLANGVVRHMKIDYGDFSVTGNLEEIEALPATDCP
jgi:hypothetical protein